MKRSSFSLLAGTLFFLAFFATAPCHAIKAGDIVFQESRSSQSEAIKRATNSRYSHMGLILIRDNAFFVCEAVQPVKLTPLKEWAARGVQGHYVVKRLRNRDSLLTPTKLKRLEELGLEFLGRPYDILFEWSDDKIYCSELVWKIYNRALGLEIGKLRELRDFNLTDPIVMKLMKERYGNNIPLDEKVISPADMFDSDLLEDVPAESDETADRKGSHQ
ncbi:MAG: hypothetical protein CVV64_17680 [Candidatus Wallbacteria bacterium HGW-Wallbacteria-1]|jgi:hypothetical protein|uniref:Peptidoglycan peptidase n=1 Tax=Candidatus Wallbacteria bacterium HGW-Wallbacteria-1 TaxID=2013854 RepID=A0A2N1PK13_9BACT|nr:MAG: hypothetical protein CVV64_17680 [Candidatus Wallbacteria bacterium HGW-Wallbacteria-1]